MWINPIFIQSRALHYLQTIMSLFFFVVCLVWVTENHTWITAFVLALVYLGVLVMGSLTQEMRAQLMYQPEELEEDE